ncbi:sugar phosphorylase [Methylophaga sp. OBS3]|uniref:sugar phosphorylase n=1 Tax=Methylophaga sp. OBS3 TaxID=2991934 RepID=UPI00225805A4|nr:sugar phosphorylase [Methylophaga sp. OBS3]MCX4190013.1 sugar phosphorylase [Methylophaga sp. OBS3]
MNTAANIHPLTHHLDIIYAELYDAETRGNLASELMDIMRLDADALMQSSTQNKWQASDIAVISYGASVIKDHEKPLVTLKRFAQEFLQPYSNMLHILPFFPYCSDDGFAVKDFMQVDPTLGDWEDINAIAKDCMLMADLVINHASTESKWFENFQRCEGEGHDFFYTADANADIDQVVRPRTSPLLRPTETADGLKNVWCTFSHTQADLDFRNPAVLKMIIRIIRFYLDQGVRLFRLDAVAFVWKEPGTSSLNLPQTHEIVRLLRLLIEHAQPDAIIITETNIPNRENLSYFGNGNEAHWIYNFSLPPLLLNTMMTGDSSYLRQWLMSMPPAQQGTAYFNFIASHDGIGLRPAEGLLSEQEITTLISTMQGFGGEISWRASANGIKKPYEINIALFDAMQGTVKGPDNWQIPRFLCAHGIMLALEGVPGIYIHSLLATSNDYQRVESLGYARAINRHQWQDDDIRKRLQQHDSQHSLIYRQLTTLIQLRRQQPAFHPNATQYTLQLGQSLFGFWRQSQDRRQSIFCIFNITDSNQTMYINDLNLVATDTWRDLISGESLENWPDKLSLAPYQMLWLSNS